MFYWLGNKNMNKQTEYFFGWSISIIVGSDLELFCRPKLGRAGGGQFNHFPR